MLFANQTTFKLGNKFAFITWRPFWLLCDCTIRSKYYQQKVTSSKTGQKKLDRGRTKPSCVADKARRRSRTRKIRRRPSRHRPRTSFERRRRHTLGERNARERRRKNGIRSRKRRKRRRRRKERKRETGPRRIRTSWKHVDRLERSSARRSNENRRLLHRRRRVVLRFKTDIQ